VKSHLRRALAALRQRFGVPSPDRGRQSAEGEI